MPAVLLAAAGPAKEKAIAKYKQAVDLAEKLNVYREDIFHVVPRIRLAGESLLRENYAQADQILGEVLEELRILEAKKPAEGYQAFRLEWLEFYREIIQKYALIALLAYLFIRIPYFRNMIRKGGFSLTGKIYLSLLIGIFAILFSLFDLVRYGESAWAFLDIQVVFLAVGGLLGGVLPGLFLGTVVGIFRWVIKPEFLVYFSVALMAGVLSGLASRRMTDFQKGPRLALGVGLLIGCLHGIFVYLPMIGKLAPVYLALSVLFLMIAEGIAIFVFFGVVAVILKEENRRDMERELLKTKLLFLQAQISPHFLYNALNTIAAICQRENAFEARRLIMRLSDFFRMTLKRFDEKVTLREELNYIESYLEIEKARFQDRLRVERVIDIPEELKGEKIPFLMLQPLVENAIKHGISKKADGGTMTMKVSRQSNHLRFQVSDDGVGVDLAVIEDRLRGKVPEDEEGGIGVHNIHERLKRLYGPEYGLKYDCQPQGGTAVVFFVPLETAIAGQEAAPQ